MLFGELVTIMSRVVQAAGRKPDLKRLEDDEDYQRFLQDSNLGVYVYNRDVVLLQVLEQLMLTVDPAGDSNKIDEPIYHAMKLAFLELGRSNDPTTQSAKDAQNITDNSHRTLTLDDENQLPPGFSSNPILVSSIPTFD